MSHSIPASSKSAITEKEQRKAAAARADDPAIFARTQYGRLRIPPWYIRVPVAVALLVASPFIVLYRMVRGVKRESSDRAT